MCRKVDLSSSVSDFLILPLAAVGAMATCVVVKRIVSRAVTKIIQWLDPIAPSENEVEFALYGRPLIPIKDIETYIAEKPERPVVNGAERQIAWANHTLKEQTQYAVVYLHGWGACKQECAPIPQDVAKALQANLYCARLPGHGRRKKNSIRDSLRSVSGEYESRDLDLESLRHHPDNPDGDALLQEATPHELFLCALESLRIGLSLGNKVILIGMSTGGCLSTWLSSRACVQRHGSVASLVLISPAYALGHPLYPILKTTFSTLRLVPHILGIRENLLAAASGGKMRYVPILNPNHVRYNCLTYPSAAVLHLLDVLWEMESHIEDVTTIEIPVLMVGNPEGHVVDFRVTAANTFLKLGNVHGPNGSSKVLHCVTVSNNSNEDNNDLSSSKEKYGYHPHVIASQNLSPALLDEMFTIIHKFLQSNLQAQQQNQRRQGSQIPIRMISTRKAEGFVTAIPSSNLERTRSVPTGMGSFASLPSLSDLSRPLLP